MTSAVPSRSEMLASRWLQIASWAYGKDKIRLHAHTEHSLEHYADNEEWRLLNVTVNEEEYEHEGINVQRFPPVLFPHR